ncbi:MAG: Na+/H+ antiporter NhaC family protein, partial [Tumebacillaceae bacterium]
LFLGLMLGWLVAVGIAAFYKMGWQPILQGTYQGMRSTFMVISILLMLAGVISTWMASGTVPALIFYGVKLVHPNLLVVTAFLLAAATSMMLGSTVGTLSTMGVAIASIAHVFGIPPALIGGALLSGGMVGDRVSPVSGTFHLVANMTGTKAEDNYKPMWQTGLPMILLCVVLYLWLGYGKVSGHVDPLASPMVRQLAAHFALPWYLMLPPVLVLVLAALRVPINRNLLLGVLFGGVLGVLVEHRSVGEMLHALWLGFDLQANGQTVLHGGGIWPMFEQLLLILMAGALNGVLERTGMMQTIIQVLLNRIRTARGLIASTVLLSIVMAMVACNQALSVIVPGRALRKTYDEMGVPPRLLVRSLADSGVVTAALIPWNLHGILCSTAIGVATTVYFPYAFYLWGTPLLTLFLALRIKNQQNSKKVDKLRQF